MSLEDLKTLEDFDKVQDSIDLEELRKARKDLKIRWEDIEDEI